LFTLFTQVFCKQWVSMQCYIVREKAPRGLLSKAPHVYKLYLEEGNVFLLAARRREHTKCPRYVITQDETSMSRSSNTYCGKIRVRPHHNRDAAGVFFIQVLGLAVTSHIWEARVRRAFVCCGEWSFSSYALSILSVSQHGSCFFIHVCAPTCLDSIEECLAVEFHWHRIQDLR
jgi:hypothetical protein